MCCSVSNFVAFNAIAVILAAFDYCVVVYVYDGGIAGYASVVVLWDVAATRV